MVTAKYRIKQYQHLVESDDAVMNSCEEEIQKLESQIQDTSVNLDAIMSADSDAQKGQDDYKAASAAWETYRTASDEILKLSCEGKQQEASKLMTGEVYEEYKAFAEKLTILRDEFQAELDQAKTMANVCTITAYFGITPASIYPHSLAHHETKQAHHSTRELKPYQDQYGSCLLYTSIHS